MNTRLQQFLAAENITQAQLADSLQVARAGVSHIIAGRNKPSYDFLTTLMTHYPRLNIEWLMFGKGKMYKDAAGDPAPVQENKPAQEVLFADGDLFEEENNDTLPEPVENINFSNRIKTLDKVVEVAVKQRNVKKILILFDDGSFQEM